LTQFVDIVGFSAIDSKHEVGPERMQLLHFKILDVFMGVYTLMSIGLLRPDVAILWYACYGGATEQFGGNSVKLLGGTWDSVVDLYERGIMDSVVKGLESDAFRGIYSKIMAFGHGAGLFLFILSSLGNVLVLFW
jgi:hypothetical protein